MCCLRAKTTYGFGTGGEWFLKILNLKLRQRRIFTKYSKSKAFYSAIETVAHGSLLHRDVISEPRFLHFARTGFENPFARRVSCGNANDVKHLSIQSNGRFWQGRRQSGDVSNVNKCQRFRRIENSNSECAGGRETRCFVLGNTGRFRLPNTYRTKLTLFERMSR
jgi:hypothetical protein